MKDDGGSGDAGSVRPGDPLAVVYDPEATVPPRGVDPESERGRLADLAALACALVAGCVLAVVRSFLLAPAPTATETRPRPSAD